MLNFKNLIKKISCKKNHHYHNNNIDNNIDALKNLIIYAYEGLLKKNPTENEIKFWLDFFSHSNYKTLHHLNKIKSLTIKNPGKNFENILNKLLNKKEINRINQFKTSGLIVSNADILALKYFFSKAFRINFNSINNNNSNNEKKIVYFHIP
jgi:hypothetical protein